MITILGPTASGKTSVAVHLADRIAGEIISADSRQVYRGMDIGTGKDLHAYSLPGRNVPYHLIDIVDPGFQYNVFEFQRDFENAYQRIAERGNVPVFCGGSGMYIESILKAYQMIHVPVNPLLRNELEALSSEALSKRLKALKSTHNQSDFDTRKRTMRAIEIAEYQKSYSYFSQTLPSIQSSVFGVYVEREERRKRIRARLDERLQQGMIDEVVTLIKKGIKAEQLLYYGLEYKWITLYITNEVSYELMYEKLLVAIYQFAKRQMTWFRRMEKQGCNIHWIDGTLPLERKLLFIQTKIGEK